MVMTGSNRSPINSITVSIKNDSSTGSDHIGTQVLKDSLLGILIDHLDHLHKKEILIKIMQINHDQVYRNDC